MTAPFSVRSTPRFDRLLKKLSKRHPDLPKRYAEALRILQADAYNRTRMYPIRKLEGASASEGQYRLRSGRWRFRYDVWGQEVELNYCRLRREETYR